MEANELRIGNYIASGAKKDDIETWVVGKVHSISSLEVDFEQLEIETEDEFTWFFKDSYWGVPLTEEWLLKLGFRQNVTFIGIEFVGGMFLVFRAGCIQMESTHSKILRFDGCKYVHQLQNLYYALTQEELTFQS